MKILKWVLIAVGSAIVLFAAVLAFIAATFDPNQYKAQIAELVQSKLHRTLTLEGDIRLVFFPKIGVRLGRTQLSELNGNASFAGLEDMRVSLAVLPLIRRQIVVDQIVLDGAHADLVRYKNGKTNFDDLLGAQAAEPGEKPAAPAPEQAPIRFEVGSVRMSKARLSWRDESTGAKYAVSDFNLSTGRIAPPAPTKFDLSARVSGQQPRLDVRLQAAGMLAADLQQQVFTLSGLALKVDGDAAGINGLAAELSGVLSSDLKRQSAAADVVLKLGDSRLKAKIAVLDLATHRSTFDLDIDRFNVDRYLPASAADERAQAPAQPQPEQPIDFSALRKLDLDGDLRVGELTVSNLKIQNLRAHVRANNGRLDADPLSASLYQGSVQGAASIDAEANRLALRQNLAGVAIGPLLRDLTGRDLLDGRGSIALDLRATGNLVSTLKKTLNGRARLELRDGAIHGIDLAQAARKARALLGSGKSETDESAASGQKTVFSEMSASFDIKNGIAHNSDLQATSPLLRLSGAGDINIPQGSLNYLTRATLVASGAGQGGPATSDLAGLAIPVRASGPFTALKYRIELRSMLTDSARQKLDAQKDLVKEKLQEKLKSRLLGPAQPGAAEPAPDKPPAQQAAPEDKLKEKLRKLF